MAGLRLAVSRGGRVIMTVMFATIIMEKRRLVDV